MSGIALTATYRLQMNAGFTFEHARARVDYFAQLGVSHLYLSPILAARRGSTHGYDVVDPTRINPELGTERDLRALSQRAARATDGPHRRHRSQPHGNRRRESVLGRCARARRTISLLAMVRHRLDVERRGSRQDRSARARPTSSSECSRAASCRWSFAKARRRASSYLSHSFPGRSRRRCRPICSSRRSIPRKPASWRSSTPVSRDGTAFARCSRDQHYRLADWRRGSTEINYRRFFDVSDLVALRVEDPTVFDETHALMLHLVRDGVVDGLRIDHVDGLLDPQAYLDRLRAATSPDTPIVVEKILVVRRTALATTGRCKARRATSSSTISRTCFTSRAASREIETFYRRLRRLGTHDVPRDRAHGQSECAQRLAARRRRSACAPAVTDRARRSKALADGRADVGAGRVHRRAAGLSNVCRRAHVAG